MATDPSTALDSSRNAFGTFGGVFTPSILTILGVIMFMRTGYVVGEAGVWGALGILTLASAITFLTGLSISAISTNIQVEGGGAYFLISRSLGPAYGGAIGLALFLAQALSVPFYILGFVEAFVALVPSMSEHFFLIGATVTAVLYVVNIVGANLAIKAQYFILAVLIASVIAFLSGGLSNFSVELLQTNANPVWDENGLSFWVLFAVFFPAVTG
ncbi:MAG: amino acid transporter, partial [Bradymonadia bacterium]